MSHQPVVDVNGERVGRIIDPAVQPSFDAFDQVSLCGLYVCIVCMPYNICIEAIGKRHISEGLVEDGHS